MALSSIQNRNLPVPAILLGIGLCAFLFWLYHNTEWVEEEKRIEQSAEARQNPMLGAQRLLEEYRYDVEVVTDRRIFDDLTSRKVGLIWLNDITVIENQAELDTIIDWVDSGGHLMIGLQGPSRFSTESLSAELLDYFGINLLTTETGGGLDWRESINSESDTTRIYLPDESVSELAISIATRFVPYMQNVSDADYHETILSNDYIVHKRSGNGFITALSNNALFYSDNLDNENTGYLLLWLTRPVARKEARLIFRLEPKPGLMTFLWNRFTLPIVVLGLVLLAFLRMVSSRLGPVEQESAINKHNLMAHLRARGEFWHKHKHTQSVVEEVQQETLSHLASLRGRQYDENKLADQKPFILKQAAALLQCTEQDAESVLFEIANNDNELIIQTQQLQRLLHSSHSSSSTDKTTHSSSR